MLRLVILVGVVAAVLSQAPPPCCSPDKWEALEAGQGGFLADGKPEILTVISYISFDRNEQKVFAFTNTTAGAKTFSQKIYQDFNTKVQYTYDVREGTCVKSDIPRQFNNGCLPKDARYMGEFSMGLGKEFLRAKSYTLHVDESGVILDASITVTEDLCVPIGENVVGSQSKEPLAITYGFVNVTPGIRDPAIFNLPAACKKNATKVEFLPQVQHHRRAFF